MAYLIKSGVDGIWSPPNNGYWVDETATDGVVFYLEWIENATTKH